MTEIYAHDWNILGDDRIQRWPSKIGEKRKLRIDIRSWVGLSIGAKHIDVQISEQKNMWWSEQENAWVELSCDCSNIGYELNAKVLNEDDGIKIAKAFVSIVAGEDSKNHDVIMGSIINDELRLKLKNAIPAISNYFPHEIDPEEKPCNLKAPGRAKMGGLRTYVTKKQVKK
jgi:hypothetical protein